MIEIWMEGFSVTGQSQGAQKIGEYEVQTFDQAIEQYIAENPDTTLQKDRFGKGRHAIWACELYDNEAKARKSFG
ncbi:MAG: hypothetical protein KAU20_05355 [Nanoarchaeota archaeon]|nr:hypothetical protein [Nanoarchaeota archaeon]